jgi:hypothetical protein
MQIKLKTTVKWWRFCVKVEIISPPPNKYSTSRLQIHTQTAKSGGIGDVGDIFHTRWMGGHNFFL